MLTHIPVPTWRELARGLIRPPRNDAELAAPWCRAEDTVGWLSRSQWSLALIVLWRMRQGTTPVRVWVPDYFCNSALTALRRLGAQLVFYPLGDGLAPDLAACRALAESAPPHVALLVHYFGEPAPSAPMRDFCARHGAWLVEDAVHALRPSAGIGSHGDFVMYSPHKHLAIPDGAVLVARTRGASQLDAQQIAGFGPPGGWAAQVREMARTVGIAGLRGSGAATWLAKRVAQKVGLLRFTRGTVPFAEAEGAVITDAFDAPELSGLARRLLGASIVCLSEIARHRQRNQMLWDSAVVGGDGTDRAVLPAARPASRAWTPYLSAYTMSPDTAAATFSGWQRSGIPVTTWPDMPPEVAANRERHAAAWHLRHSRVFLPVHQSLNAGDILRHTPGRRGAPSGDSGVTARWNQVARKEWAGWIEQAGRSNVLQSWAYGEVKSSTSGWTASRVAFFKEGAPIAIAQVLEWRVGRVVCAFRVNRGPLPLRILDEGEKLAVLRQLAALGSWTRGRVLSLAPEVALSGESLRLMGQLGLRQRSTQTWESVWIDLAAGPDVVRKQLDGKWRNMLVSAEKARLAVEIGSDDRMFDWMMARYEELVREKDFEGTPVSILLGLRAHQGDDLELVVLRAMHEGEPVAGICVAAHGATATYLLGWNGPAGRNLKANQYLLWQAVVHLQQDGLRWFDLGGINEDTTPGITAFKLGMNGSRYELVGEYLKW